MINTLCKQRKVIALFLLELFFAQTLLANAGNDRMEYSANFRQIPGDQYLFTSAAARYYNAQARAINKITSITTRPTPATANREEAEKQHFIGGPGQPEMSSFKSVNSNNMVDLFTGDFSYNIPLLDVGGYPVNIHYSSGISMDQEASWVGLGWNINPGVIGRTTRGLPDDFNGTDSIVRTQSIKENRTIGANISATAEVVGFPIRIEKGLGAFHNTYNGWGTETFTNVSINSGNSGKAYLSGSLSLSNNSQTGLNVQPSLSFNLGKKTAEWNGAATISTNYNSRAGISALQLNTEVRAGITTEAIKRDKEKSGPEKMDIHDNIGMGIPSSISFATPSYLPTITMPLTNAQYSFKLKVGSANWAVFTNAAILGYVSRSYIKPEDKRQSLPAYGYLYFSQNKSPYSLLDFNREKEVAFNAKSTPHIAIPQYSYDVYSISGEGISGSFRPYRGDVGYIYDHAVSTKSENNRLNTDLGFGQYFHGGIDFDFVTATTTTGAWTQNNAILKNLKFQTSDSAFEEVYFRNPGEKTSNDASFYRQLGGDSLIQVQLSGDKDRVKGESEFSKYSRTLTPAGQVNVTAPIVKQRRDKRSQVISYIKAGEAYQLSLDPVIRSIKENENPLLGCTGVVETIQRVGGVRKDHHLSEIDVLNPDGRRYVYGLPVYNLSQEDVIFSVNKDQTQSNTAKGLAQYSSADATTANEQGKESYYTRDSTPAHAHSFLLTGILSTDYVDIKGDGITEDDLGDGVKFNYTQVYGGLHNNPFSWRTPADTVMATYNEGLKTYNRDDKGTYLYGTKEVWYLNSIESKTMIALFKVSKRSDAFSVAGPDGGTDRTKALRRLESILLYSKADLIKNGSQAKPVKTVHFEYETETNRQLCQGASGVSGTGKLTLKKIWFTYNNNKKGSRNPYLFSYHPAGNNIPKAEYNPGYSRNAYDRWGNYKDPNYKTAQYNPGGLNNQDYPYAVQDSAKAASFASVWHLTDIRLPSGSRMHVEYESDDYAFVQNKRAAQMFPVAGFGSSETEVTNKLYNNVTSDNNYIFINSTAPLNNRDEVYQKYLRGLEDQDGTLKIYFKVAVRMPNENDKWSTSSKFEMIPGYAEVQNFGIAGGPGATRFWLQLKPVNGTGVLVKTALQFLRLNLPSKAYPTSEIGDDVKPAQVVKMLASKFGEIQTAVTGFEDTHKRKWHCQTTEPGKSFIRLASPDYKKYGGGIRVKRIEISDNWNAMTGQKESVYGQEYTYATSYVRGRGDTIAISSGVASYEPMIGGEENPFRLPVEYTEKLAPLGPSNFLYTEAPLGESFFPAPMVGYSKVRVRTINARAKSANGWTESEYYTTKDFPTLVDRTPLDKRSYNPRFNFLKVNAQHQLTVSQGFRVELNDMNGKPKAESVYAENDSLHPIHYTASFYKVENDLAFSKKLDNTVWAVDSASGHINKQALIGKEVEVMVDVREQMSYTFSGNLGVNVDIIPGFIPPFIPLPSAIPLPQREQSRFRSVAVTKVVQRYGILDSVVVIDKGSVVSTKNLVFDAETGLPLVTRTNNEYNDPLYSFNYPARWAYSGMGMAYENLGILLHKKKMKEGRLLEWNEAPSPAEKYFESGDEVWLTGSQQATVAPNTTQGCGKLIPGPEEKEGQKLWAVAASKGIENHQGIYFIDKDGKPYTGIVEDLKIIRSGKRNFTDAYIGSIVSLNSPVRTVNGQESRIIIDQNTKVVQAGATAFKDLWNVENSLYEKDSCYTKTTLTTTTFTPSQSMLMHQFKKGGSNSDYREKNSMPTPFFTASLKNYPNCSGDVELRCRKTKTYRTKSILKFNLTPIPANATVLAATLDLHPRQISKLWSDVPLDEINNYLSDKLNAHYVRDNADALARTNTSVLQRVKNSWNQKTGYLDIATYPETVNVDASQDNVCEDRNDLNVTALVQPMVASPQSNYGFLLRLQNDEHGNNHDYQFRAMSFCAGGTAQPAYSLNQTLTVQKNVQAQVAPSCSNCYTPTLTVTYSYQKDTCVKLCRYNITDTTNPYRWGILGNWRPDKAFTYYADRTETNASQTQTDIRKEGVLKEFLPYWLFSGGLLTATTDTTRWVWNSASSLYNRKGFEIENYDPLGRYNAGLYGYNETLPVAVAQNSKYRELLFDGFEDYQYQTQNCDAVCPTPKEIDFVSGNPAAATYSAESHTGKYSLQVQQAGEAVFTAPVIPLSEAQPTPSLSMRVDSTPIYTSIVNGKGNGLTATYTCASGAGQVQRVEGPLNFVYNNYTALLPENCSRYAATWVGKLQPKYGDVYTITISTPFVFGSSSGGGVIITDPESNSVVLNISEGLFGGSHSASTSQPLQAGKLYDIKVTYPSFRKTNSAIQLSWFSIRQPQQIIPGANLYPNNVQSGDTVGSVVQFIKEYCIKPNAAKPLAVITPRFSPVQKQKMVVCAWMKVPSDCDNSIVTAEGQITASFNTGESVTLLKTGLPVEGWQRYENQFTIPDLATQIQLHIKAMGSPVLVDDIRVQPYSSSVKAYVYDPVSLRLMSELDENNYAAFYEYDDDGTLVRVKKETEKGVMTIKETRSALLQ